MDPLIIDSLINSIDIIESTITSNENDINGYIQDIFKQIVDLNSDSNEIKALVDQQGNLDAETIRGIVSEGKLSSIIDLDQLANLELDNNGKLTDDTINGLVDVIRDVSRLLENLSPQTIATIPNSAIDLNKLNETIENFRAISSLSWCKDWAGCLESIISQASTVKDELATLPESIKTSIGIANNDIMAVEESIQKVQETITTQMTLPELKIQVDAEIQGNQTQLNSNFLDGFSEYMDKLTNMMGNFQSGNSSSESFISNLTQSTDNILSVVNNTLSTFNENISSSLIPSSVPIAQPIGIENTVATIGDSIRNFDPNATVGNSPAFGVQQLLQPILDIANVAESAIQNTATSTLGDIITFESSITNAINNAANIDNSTLTGKIEQIENVSNKIFESSTMISNIQSTIDSQQTDNLLELINSINGKINDKSYIREGQEDISKSFIDLGATSSTSINDINDYISRGESTIFNAPLPTPIDISKMAVQLGNTVPTSTAPTYGDALVNQIPASPIPLADIMNPLDMSKYPYIYETSISTPNRIDSGTALIRNQDTYNNALDGAITRIESGINAPDAFRASIAPDPSSSYMRDLSSNIISSIDNLSSIIKDSIINNQIQSPARAASQDAILNNNTQPSEISKILDKLDATLQEMKSIQMSQSSNFSQNTMSDSQARMIGKVIASELKNSLGTLHR